MEQKCAMTKSLLAYQRAFHRTLQEQWLRSSIKSFLWPCNQKVLQVVLATEKHPVSNSHRAANIDVVGEKHHQPQAATGVLRALRELQETGGTNGLGFQVGDSSGGRDRDRGVKIKGAAASKGPEGNPLAGSDATCGKGSIPTVRRRD